MPRTRAALRNAIFEDLEDAAAVPLPSTPQKGGDRAPLGEILLNEEAPPRIQPDVDMKKPGTAVPAKKDKRVGRKKKPVNKENDRPGRDPMVVEDDYESSSSTSAVEEACQELRNAGKDENFRAPYLDRRPQTPPSKAVRAARRKLSPKSETPRFNPKIHKAPESATKQNPTEDSFVAAIGSRSPAKIMNAEPIAEEVQEENMATPDTGVTKVSPEKSPRIEDSVEAIDALQEAIEKAGESFIVAPEALPPTKERKPASKNSGTVKPLISKKEATKPKANTSKPIGERRVSMPKASLQKPSAAKPAGSRPVVAKKPSQPSLTKPAGSVQKGSQPTRPRSTRATPSKPPNSAAKPTLKPQKPRVSSVTNPPFVPTKSTKAPTRSTFTLPGEAISAKLKAQREERLKKEEEEKKFNREFKARPAPNGRVSSIGSAPLPRQNAASRARLSLAQAGKVTGGIDVPIIAKTGPKPRVSSTKAVVDGPGSKPTAPAARLSTFRPSPSVTLPSRSVSSPNKAVTATIPAAKSGSVRGKSIVNSFKAQKEEQHKALKEKMEATKKARAQAAERGRSASKQWAERKKKEAEAKKANGEQKASFGEGKELASEVQVA